jgi:hypothetical protein
MFMKVIWVSGLLSLATCASQERFVVMPEQLSPWALEGNLGSAQRFVVPAGQTVTRDLIRARVVGGDKYSGGITISITPQGNGPYPNVFISDCLVQFGNDGFQGASANIGINRGITFTVPAGFVAVQVSITALAGQADIVVGAFATLTPPVKRSPLLYMAGSGALLAGASVTITNFRNYSKQLAVSTSDDRVDDIFIEGISSFGTVIFGTRQGPGLAKPVILTSLLMTSLRITNIGAGDIANYVVIQEVEF